MRFNVGQTICVGKPTPNPATWEYGIILGSHFINGVEVINYRADKGKVESITDEWAEVFNPTAKPKFAQGAILRVMTFEQMVKTYGCKIGEDGWYIPANSTAFPETAQDLLDKAFVVLDVRFDPDRETFMYLGNVCGTHWWIEEEFVISGI